jgi:hypothetical protein
MTGIEVDTVVLTRDELLKVRWEDEVVEKQSIAGRRVLVVPTGALYEIPLRRVLADREVIYSLSPHRYDAIIDEGEPSRYYFVEDRMTRALHIVLVD